ncbi:hypothetical protein BJ166DRAFT_510285 [Pestalotiopsis sp. NC0098]|nr:hypothetical protein BJ166DRAFT_510285 [Pestalotiopsis sp. NC0098]
MKTCGSEPAAAFLFCLALAFWFASSQAVSVRKIRATAPTRQSVQGKSGRDLSMYMVVRQVNTMKLWNYVTRTQSSSLRLILLMPCVPDASCSYYFSLLSTTSQSVCDCKSVD